jgi:hypothetical protein
MAMGGRIWLLALRDLEANPEHWTREDLATLGRASVEEIAGALAELREGRP